MSWHQATSGGAGFEVASDQVGDLEAVGTGEGGAAAAPAAPAGHAVQAHQPSHLLLVDHQPGPAQLAVHPGHPVVAVGGVEDFAHQLDQLGLGDLTLGRPGRLSGLPVVEP
jgi:hypothetical protein